MAFYPCFSNALIRLDMFATAQSPAGERNAAVLAPCMIKFLRKFTRKFIEPVSYGRYYIDSVRWYDELTMVPYPTYLYVVAIPIPFSNMYLA